MAKETKIFDSDIRYNTEYRKINYPRLEFRKGELELILPLNYKEEHKLLEKHRMWIRDKQKLIETALIHSSKKKLVKRDVGQLRKLIFKFINKENLAIKKVYFRNMRSKWGSCSASKNLTFNTLLRYLPDYLVRYVVVHELTHFKEKKHNGAFWRLLSNRFKSYEKYEKDLMIYWFLIERKLD